MTRLCVRIGNDLIHWVRFFLQGIAETGAKGRDGVPPDSDLTDGSRALGIDAGKACLLMLGKRAAPVWAGAQSALP